MVVIGRSEWESPDKLGGEVSKGAGVEVKRCRENAGWMLKMVGEEESASEICKDIEDRSSWGITAETLNEVLRKESRRRKEQCSPNWMGIRRFGERKLSIKPRRMNQGSVYGGLQLML